MSDRCRDADDIRIIEYINKHEGVEWMTMAAMAQEVLDGKIDVATVEGGVDS